MGRFLLRSVDFTEYLANKFIKKSTFIKQNVGSMKFLKSTFLIIIFLFFINALNAQSYNNGVGIRIGLANGVGVALDYKHFFSESIAVEAIVDFNQGLTIIGGLIEFHKSLYQVSDGFTFYYGGGAGVATGSGFSRMILLGVAGLDFKFAELPIDVAFDWTPNLLLGEGGRFSADSLSIILRYTF